MQSKEMENMKEVINHGDIYRKYNNHLSGIPGRQQMMERIKAIIEGKMAETFQEMTNHRFKKPNNPNKDK